jgi:hypothetical protein
MYFMEMVTVSWSADRLTPEGGFPALDSEQTLVLAFGPSSLLDAPAPLQALSAAYPSSCLLGCSTAGEIAGPAILDNTLTAAVVRFRSTRLRRASAPVSGAADSFAAGRTIGEQLATPGLRGVLVLSDGLQVNGSELIRGLNSVLADSVAITGGLAGDADRFARTWVLHKGQPVAGQVSAVGFYGDDVIIHHGSRGGWDIFGPERLVTRASGNVLYELDGKPALALYKEYLGERAAELPGSALLFPLSLRAGKDDTQQVVRTILAVNESEQSMTFAGDIPNGHLAQLMRANFDRLIEGAYGAARNSIAANDDLAEPGLVVAISCVGRRLVLGERAEEEVESTLRAFPDGTRQVGFYSYGEIAPSGLGRCDLHNQTMTLTTIAERS